MELNKDAKIKLELDFIKATVLLDMINTSLDKMMELSSMESALKYIVLREIAKSILDQVVPQEEQDKIIKEHEETLLQALRKERESKL